MPLEIIILAAGRGKRMKSQLPKVLHPIGGRPMLWHVLETCLQLKPKAIHIVVGVGREQVEARVQAFIDQLPGRRAKPPIIRCVKQEQPRGTGHAVMQALPQVGKRASVLVLNGDTPLLLGSTLKRVAQPGPGLRLLTVTMDNPRRTGRIMRDPDGNICGVVEYPDATPAQRRINEVNTNCLCVKATALYDWLRQIQPNNKQAEYYLPDVIALAVRDGVPVEGISPTHVWETPDVNDRADLAQLERQYQLLQARQLLADGVTVADPSRLDIRGRCRFGLDCRIDINVILEGTIRVGNHVTIGPNCILRDTVIGDYSVIEANSMLEEARIGQHCRIGPYARLRPGTSLSDRVRIGNFVETKNSRLGQNSKANHLSYVGDSEVGVDVNIGAGVITCNYDGANKHQTHIGNNVFIGSDSQLVAPVHIADGATIGAGSTITDNVARDVLVLSRTRQRSVDNWQRPQKKTMRKKPGKKSSTP